MTALAHPISLFPFTQPGTASSSHNSIYRDEEIDPHEPTPTSASSTVPRSDLWMTDEDQGLSPSTSKTSSTDQEHTGFNLSLGFDPRGDREVELGEDGKEDPHGRRKSSGVLPRTPVETNLRQSQDLGLSKGLGLEGLDTTGIHDLNDDLDEHLDRRLSRAHKVDLEESVAGVGVEDSIVIRPIPSFALRKPSTPGTPYSPPPQLQLQPRTLSSLTIDPPAPTLEPIGRFASPPGTATTIQTMIMSPSFSAFPSPGPGSPSASVSGGTTFTPTFNRVVESEPVSPLTSNPGSDLPSRETSPGHSPALSPGSDPGTTFDFGGPSPYPHLSSEMRNTMSTPALLASPGLLAPNVFSTLTLNSTGTTSTKKNKRSSRKQAPALTESLENLGSSLTLPTVGFGSGTDEWGNRGGSGYDGKSPVELGPPISPVSSTSLASPSARKYGAYSTTTSRKQEEGGRRSSFSLGLGGPLRSKVPDEREEVEKKGTRRRSLQLLTSFAGFGGARRKSEVMLDGSVSPVKATGESNQGEGRESSSAVVHGEEEEEAVDLKRSSISRTISPVSPGRLHALHRLPTPQRDRKRASPPSIPPRIHSLPVDPASPAAVLRSHEEGNKGEEQLPLDHFSFGQTEGDAIVKLDVHDARRPSEQTFMTGYSLGGGPGAGSTDEDRLPVGTIDLNSDDGHEDEERGLSRSGAISGTKPSDETPALFTSISSVTIPTTRPREDLPFGRSRRNLGSASGTSTPTEVPGDGEFTPRPALTPSSSFVRRAHAPNGVPKQLGQYVRSESKRSMSSVVTKRRPVQWAELDALEAEEARLRAEQRREERARQVKEDKTGPVRLVRRASSRRDTRGNKSGTSTDTSDDGTKLKREGFRNRRARLKREAELFDALQNTIPGYDDLMAASMVQIRDDQGTKIEFGKVIEGGLGKRYVVIFIRHWYCPLCAQYTESIIRTIDQESLERAKVELIIIGNGSYKMIPGYSKSVKCPFKMYTDSKLRLYKALGMTRQTGDAGEEDEKGDYVRMSNLESTWQVAKRATKMPLKNPG